VTPLYGPSMVSGNWQLFDFRAWSYLIDSDKRDYDLVAKQRNSVLTASQAIDAAPTADGDESDLDRDATDLDMPLVPDRNLG